MVKSNMSWHTSRPNTLNSDKNFARRKTLKGSRTDVDVCRRLAGIVDGSYLVKLRGKSVRSWCDGSLDRSFMVDPLSYFSFQPVLHNWCNKGHGICYPVCRMMHIKEPLLLIGKSSLCGGSGFPFLLSE